MTQPGDSAAAPHETSATTLATPATSSAAPTAGAARQTHLDALRGFALLGILVVNIMSFTGGLRAAALGPLTVASPLLDHLTVIGVALLAEFKFYPLFSFLFGYGYFLFWRNAKRKGADAKRLFNRRILFLGILGVLHGTLIWFGDILSRYALVAPFLRKHLDAKPREILSAIKRWGIAAILLGVLFSSLALLGGSPSEKPPAPIYATAGYLEALSLRVSEYLQITVLFMFLIPQVLVLFLLGVLTARMGWLRKPERHHAFWKRVLGICLVIGIPTNILWASQDWKLSMASDPGMTAMMPMLDILVPTLSAAMVALFALNLHTGPVRALVSLLAPAGRMALTNYLSQSVLCSVFLYGYGLRWGVWMTQYDLLLLALGIFAAEVAWSHWWLARHESGPMEVLWRRFTYGGAGR